MNLQCQLDNVLREIDPGGAAYSTPGKVYRDTTAEQINALTKGVTQGKPWRQLIKDEVEPRNPWLAKIILHEKRNDFLPLVTGGRTDYLALDVGAGWGQHTIDMAAQGKVCSLEPSPERFEFIRAICEQDGVASNCYFINSSLGRVSFNRIFDFAICIGVLEWVGRFEDCDDPRAAQVRFLKSLKSYLKDGAPLVVGIENRLGMKYLLGSRDDHIGIPHVACLDYKAANEKWAGMGNESLDVATYSLSEYKELFLESGFERLVFYSAMPDYKIPERIIECHPVDRLSEELVNGRFFEEHDGSNGRDCGFNPELRSLYKTLGKEKTAPFFSPSYFIVAV